MSVRLHASLRLVVALAALAIASSAAAATTTALVPATAPHGARAVVVGTGLDTAGIGITFAGSAGRVPALIITRTATLLELVVPATATSGAVQVDAGAGPIGSLPFTLAPDAPFVNVATLAASDKAHDVFKNPSHVAVEASTGTVIVADTAHHRLVAVAPNGTVSVLAGSGKPGLTDGSGLAAQFKEPSGVAVDDAKRRIYVADTGNHVIRAVSYDGVVTTLAGTGRPDDALGFKQPTGVTVDANGNVIVADTGNSKIKLVTPAGAITTIAGAAHPGLADGPAQSALFKEPEGVAAAPSGAIYVADTKNNVIRKIENGVVTTIAGTGHDGLVDGPGTRAEFKQPSQLAADDAGNVWVADSGNSAIRQIHPDGTVSTLVGNGKGGYADGALSSALFKNPAGIAFAGALFIGDSGNDALRVIYPTVDVTAVYPSAGPPAGGNTVRVFGTGFIPGATQVTFGTSAATAVAFVSATELLVIAPAGAVGAVDLAVTTPAGRDVLTGAYTYLPPPTIATVDPVKGTTGGGNTVQITGTNFFAGPEMSVAFGPNKASSLALTNSTALTAVTPSGSAGPVDVTVSTIAGSATKTAAFTYFAPPVITSFTPAQGSAGASVAITGQNFDPDTTGDQVSFGNLAATVLNATATQLVAIVPSGAVTAKITVTTAGGSIASAADFVVASFTKLQITAPTFTIDVGQSLQLNAIGVLATGGGVDVTAKTSWISNNSAVSVTSTGIITASSAGGADITATLNDFSATVHVSANALLLPPDPKTVAPPENRTQITPFADSTAFLYQGATPIQTGVAANAIAPYRAAVVRGRVLTRDGMPLAGVRVSIVGHPEFGQTLSRSDGWFDLAVNGGGVLTVRYARPGYLASDRAVNVPWRDFVSAGDVALVGLDTAVASIASGVAAVQVARASTATDKDGPRTATLLFPAGTTASMTLPDGTVQPLPSLSVRATEYSVGPNGEKAMPAVLPPTTSYTYCVELSADEAINAGATTVTFSKPVAFYVENFLSFPAGTVVPVGYYDRGHSRWTASDNGRVIKILSIVNGSATIDSNGDGVADDATTLAALGVDAAELQQLAKLYAPGQTLWRAPLMHFTPFDCNWTMYGGPPRNALAPTARARIRRRVGNPTTCPGSLIDCQNQILREGMGLAGTGLTMHYSSGEQPGRRDMYKIDVTVTGVTPPAGFVSTEVDITLAGRTFQQTVSSSPNVSYTFDWDGRDAYDRVVQGPRFAVVTVGYTYRGERYLDPGERQAVFAQWPKNLITLSLVRAEVTLWTSSNAVVGNLDARPATGLGGWTLSSHHIYDADRRILHLGTGETRDAADLGRVLVRAAGNADCCVATEGVDARNTALNYPVSVASVPDGSFYIANVDTILRVTPEGIMTRVAGIPNQAGFSPDGTPALTAKVNPWFVALGPDGLYFIESGRRVRRIGTDGTLVTVAGNGSMFGDITEGPATNTYVDCEGLAVAPDGTLYIASSRTIERVTPDGQLTIIAGIPPSPNPVGVPPANGVSAQQAFLGNVLSVAVGPTGDIFFADTGNPAYVAQITGDGILNVVAGLGANADADDVPARSISIGSDIWGLDVGRDGTVYFATLGGQTVRAVRPDGTIVRVAGGAPESFKVTPYPDNVPAVGSPVFYPWDVKSAPDGSLLIVCYDENTIRRVTPAFPGASPTETIVGSPTGAAGYVFDSSGRHLRTVDAKTGAVLATFSYDSNGLLSAITDRDGNTVTVDRAPDGTPAAIVAPGGQRTTLTLDSNGHLATVTDPGGEVARLAHDSNGLLTGLLTPRNGQHTFTYDGDGLLLTDSDPAGGGTTLSRTGSIDTFTVTRTTAEGRVTTFDFDNSSDLASQRRTTSPSGLTLGAVLGKDQSINVSMPGGITATGAKLPHPQFGMASPFGGNFTIKTAGGLALQIGHSETATLTDSKNPLSLQSSTHTMTLNGKSYTSTYDAGARTLTTRSPLGRSITRSLDPLGHITSSSVAGVAPVSITYDARGRVSSVTQADRNRTYSYDSLNQLTSVGDALGRTVHFAYDADGRPIGETLVDGREVSFTYDADGNMTSIVPPGRPAHSFTFNPVDEANSYTAPDVPNGGGSTLLLFNRDHQLSAATRPDGTQITYSYDSGGRVSGLATTQGAYQFSYDSSGLIQAATAPGGVSLNYTRDGIFPTSVAWSGAVNATISTAYDSTLRPTSTTLAGGTKIAYAYDDDGLLTTAGPESITRDPSNGRVTATTAGAVTDSITYATTGDVSDRTVLANGAPLIAFHYTHDAIGRITAITETVGANAASTRAFTYDAASRLASVTQDSSAATSYAYDANSNRTSRTSSSGTVTATYDAQDRLLTYGDQTFTYTLNGEVATRISPAGTTSYSYDSLGNLISVSLPDGRLIEYTLDARGRRVVKKIGGSPIAKFVYADGLRPIAQLGPDDSVVAQFVYGEASGRVSLMIRGGATYRIITDHLGSPRFVVDIATGAIADTVGYDEFGVEYETTPSFQPFGFAGGIYDADTRLVHLGAREYDPSIGRFLTKDPVNFAGGQLNVYDYAANDPVNFADPSGLLFNGAVNAGEAYGQKAVDYYADTLTDPHASTAAKVGAAVGGFFAALWTPCTSDATFTTLAAAYAADEWVGRSFWQYTSGDPAYNSPYLTRGWGWDAPYEPGVEAAERLALPDYNPGVTVNEVPDSFRFFAGGPSEVPPAFGHGGGGTQYLINGWP